MTMIKTKKTTIAKMQEKIMTTIRMEKATMIINNNCKSTREGNDDD
jgi:hypothetical protein